MKYARLVAKIALFPLLFLFCKHYCHPLNQLDRYDWELTLTLFLVVTAFQAAAIYLFAGKTLREKELRSGCYWVVLLAVVGIRTFTVLYDVDASTIPPGGWLYMGSYYMTRALPLILALHAPAHLFLGAALRRGKPKEGRQHIAG